jgi:hypothetical protein
MVFNFNQSNPEAGLKTPSINLWGRNIAEAQPENCPATQVIASAATKL